jgi:hypothetical protein
MSGQALSMPVYSVGSLALPGLRRTAVPVATWDMDELMPGTEIAGFLSLGFFDQRPFTIDYARQEITLENADSMEKIRSEGAVVPLKLRRQDVALDAFLSLRLPNGQDVSVEVDTGSQDLILDRRFMDALGVSPSDPGVRSRTGKDETGREYQRYFSKVRGSVRLFARPDIGWDSPDVMFQEIIYDGLIGHTFLKRFTVTYDLPRAEMIFRDASLRP